MIPRPDDYKDQVNAGSAAVIDGVESPGSGVVLDSCKAPLKIEIVSFGFKYGEESGDLVFNARFIPNPFYVDSLRPLSGLDKACFDYVFGFPVSRTTLRLLSELVTAMAGGFIGQGKESLKICIGCTGGQHRSVSIVEALAKEITSGGFSVSVRHREKAAGRF